MLSAKPATQPTNVGTGGTIVTVPIHVAARIQPLQRVLVVKKAGSATMYDVEISTDAAVADRAQGVVKFTDETEVDYVGPYYWRSGANLYIKIVPNAGADNAFDVILFFHED